MWMLKLFFALFLFCESILCQFDPGAKQIALAYSNTANDKDVFALFNNVACLAAIHSRQVGIYYSPAPFGMTELANSYLAYNEPTGIGTFALGGMNYGFELYREYKIVLGYSEYIFKNFSAGIALNYHAVSIKNYGKTSAVYLDAGIRLSFAEGFYLGFLIKNINRATFGGNDDQMPTLLRTGITYLPANIFSLNISIEKETMQNVVMLFGVDYAMAEFLTLRTGFSSEPAKFSGGIGINYSMLSLDYALFTHQDLGLTHQAGLIIHL